MRVRKRIGATRKAWSGRSESCHGYPLNTQDHYPLG